MSIQNVVLVGASGALGRHILDALLRASFTVTVLSRASSSGTGYPAAARVARVSDDYTYDELVPVFEGQDAVVSAIADPSLAKQTAMVDAAVAAGVRRFVPAEFGSGAGRADLAERIPVFGRKYAVLQYLKGRERAGFSWTAVANNPFFEWGLEMDAIGFDVPNRKVRIMDSGDEKWSTTTFGTIGLATARILKRPRETANRIIYIQSFHVSQNEILEQLKIEMGGTWDVTHVDSKGFMEDQERAVKENEGDEGYALIFPNVAQGDEWHSKDAFGNMPLELPREDLRETVGRIVREKQWNAQRSG